MTRNSLFALLAAGSALIGAALPVSAADLKSPEQVKNALRMLAYVQDDMARKLPSKSYGRLPHENEEFQQAAPALRDAVAGEPASFKSKVEASLSKATSAAKNVAEVSKTNDDARISAAVQSVADALKPLYELFPEALRPVPGQLGSRPGNGAAGPPPDLR